ncbi:hypothetical protein [Streptomyces naphthomycinicus]|uniref:hypothetical protein n=1 Tax=Streptomyces naphthomycinicus TaxID=2872625 RepID=UPI001CECAB54|nr:hypothetical protein [Streptomyces sp. TML10]
MFSLHREGRIPAARETIRVDGDTVKIGVWLAKARHRHRPGQLPVRLVAALFDGNGRPTTPSRPPWSDAPPPLHQVGPLRRHDHVFD